MSKPVRIAFNTSHVNIFIGNKSESCCDVTVGYIIAHNNGLIHVQSEL